MNEEEDPRYKNYRDFLEFRAIDRFRYRPVVELPIPEVNLFLEAYGFSRISESTIDAFQTSLIDQHQESISAYPPNSLQRYHRSYRDRNRSYIQWVFAQTKLWAHTIVDAEPERVDIYPRIFEHLSELGDWEQKDDALNEKLTLEAASLKYSDSEVLCASKLFGNGTPCKLTQNSPADKFHDSIELDFIGRLVLEGMEESCLYKNNLSTIVTSASGAKMLVIGNFCSLKLFQFDPLTFLPSKEPVLKLNLEPRVTTRDDFLGLTWPNTPHTLNYLKTYPDWFGDEILAVCADNGKVFVWRSEVLFEHVQKKHHVPKTSMYNLKPSFRLEVPGSAWGVDFAKSAATDGTSTYVAAVSFNKRSVQLFSYNESRDKFNLISSELFPHNVPEISILEYTVEDGLHKAICCMACISKEVRIHEFTWKLKACSLENTICYTSVTSEPLFAGRQEFDVWTAKPIEKKYFRKVLSFAALNGDFHRDEDLFSGIILQESVLLQNYTLNPKDKSSYGLAAEWQCMKASTVKYPQCYEPSEEIEDMLLDWQYNSLAQAYEQEFLGIKSSTQTMLANIIVAVTSECNLALYQANTLRRCAYTDEIFKLVPVMSDDHSYCNRILISLVIPELSCFIAATQLGLVTIMRLCQYRGVFAMRQEHIFPNFELIIDLSSTGVPLCGMTARKISAIETAPLYILHLTYLNGMVLTYRLLDKLEPHIPEIFE